MKIILTGGGTLGSVSPLIGIWQELKNKDLDLEVLFVGTKKGPEKAFVEKYGIPYKSIISGKLRRYFSLMNLIDLIKISLSIFQSFSLLIKFKTDVIISAGSFVSVPLVWASKFFKTKIVIYQPDLKLGLANKLCQKQADLIFTAFPETVEQFSKKAEVVGSVLRNEIQEVKPSEFRKKNILILGGGTGSEFLNELIAQSISKLDYNITHVTGRNKQSNVIHDTRYTIHELLTDNYYEKIAEADLVISRAGLSTLMELSYLSKPTILIPLPDSAQEQNAEYFCQKQAAVCLKQDELTSEKLVEVINGLISDEGRRTKLSSNIHNIIKHGGEKQIFKAILSL